MRKKVFVLMLAAVMVIASMLTSAALAESAEPAKIDLTGLINAAIAVLGLLITHRLVPWLKARTTSEQQQILAAGIRTAVYAAEQLYQTGVISDRLDYALKWLGSHGYSVDRAQVEKYLKPLTDNLLMGVIDERAEGITVREEDKEFIARVYSYVFIGIMLDWIKDDMKADPKLIVDKLAILMKDSLADALRRFRI